MVLKLLVPGIPSYLELTLDTQPHSECAQEAISTLRARDLELIIIIHAHNNTRYFGFDYERIRAKHVWALNAMFVSHISFGEVHLVFEGRSN